jgi:hypothetical protein
MSTHDRCTIDRDLLFIVIGGGGGCGNNDGDGDDHNNNNKVNNIFIFNLFKRKNPKMMSVFISLRKQ